VPVVQQCIGDEDLLPMLPPLDVHVVHHDPILFLYLFLRSYLHCTLQLVVVCTHEYVMFLMKQCKVWLVV
jgi:hypothetical protein